MGGSQGFRGGEGDHCCGDANAALYYTSGDWILGSGRNAEVFNDCLISGVERPGNIYIVIKWWHIRETFVDTTWGGYGRGRHIGTGEGSRGQRSIIVQGGASRGCGGRDIVGVGCRFRMMARDVAQRIRD